MIECNSEKHVFFVILVFTCAFFLLTCLMFATPMTALSVEASTPTLAEVPSSSNFQYKNLIQDGFELGNNTYNTDSNAGNNSDAIKNGTYPRWRSIDTWNNLLDNNLNYKNMH